MNIFKKVLVSSLRAFFDINEEEKIMSLEIAKKTSFLAVGRLVYAAMDWIIAAGLGSFSFWLQSINFSEVNVFLATWMYDFFAAAFFFFLSDMTKCDFTLGESLRRVSDRFAKEGFWGKIFSGMLIIGVSIKAIIWEGPEVICFLFKKELKTRINIWLALFMLSAVQGLFGTWLYTTGYRLWEEFGSSTLGSHYILLGIATFFIFFIIVAILKKIAQWGMATIRFFWQLSKADKK